MTKTTATRDADQAMSLKDVVLNPSATLTLPAVPTCEVGTALTDDSAKAREEEIRLLAHAKWEAAGCPPGDGVHFWLEAEREADAKSSDVHSAELK